MEVREEWGHMAYFDYMDRWMTEDYQAYIDTVRKYCSRRNNVPGTVNGWIERKDRKAFYVGSHQLDLLMWNEYRLDYDKTAPTRPVLSLAGRDTNRIDISIDTWDSYGIESITIFRDGIYISEIDTTLFSDTELDKNAEYTYTALAYDVAGNESELSEPLTVTTGLSSVLGIQQIYEIEIFPNPARDYISIRIDNYKDMNLIYHLYDITGHLLKQDKIENNETYVEVDDIEPAAYYLKILSNNKEIKAFKIIKTK
jgi:hypothetical protein